MSGAGVLVGQWQDLAARMLFAPRPRPRPHPIGRLIVNVSRTAISGSDDSSTQISFSSSGCYTRTAAILGRLGPAKPAAFLPANWVIPARIDLALPVAGVVRPS